jgi:hypothetical protein
MFLIGDGERLRVVAIRLGAMMPLQYQWFLRNDPVGEPMRMELYHGDLYIMSDWKMSSILTLRHSAGEAFIKIGVKKLKDKQDAKNKSEQEGDFEDFGAISKEKSKKVKSKRDAKDKQKEKSEQEGDFEDFGSEEKNKKRRKASSRSKKMRDKQKEKSDLEGDFEDFGEIIKEKSKNVKLKQGALELKDEEKSGDQKKRQSRSKK